VTETGGTAKQAAIDGYTVAGKTGPAPKVANGHYDPSKWVSSFVGVVPAEDPRLAIMIIMDEPQGGHLGGAVAAPVFKEIAEQALRYLHVPPTTAIVAKAGAKRAAPSAASAAAAAIADADEAASETPATDLPLDDDALGDDPALAEKWNEVAGAEGGRAERAPVERVMVPDFMGLSLGQAIHAARKSGVELAFDDPEGRATGVALRQRPAPGPAPRGVVCRVAFGRKE